MESSTLSLAAPRIQGCWSTSVAVGRFVGSRCSRERRRPLPSGDTWWVRVKMRVRMSVRVKMPSTSYSKFYIQRKF